MWFKKKLLPALLGKLVGERNVMRSNGRTTVKTFFSAIVFLSIHWRFNELKCAAENIAQNSFVFLYFNNNYICYLFPSPQPSLFFSSCVFLFFLLSVLLSITSPSELLPKERERGKKPSITSARVAFPCFVLVCGDATRAALSLRAEMKYFTALISSCTLFHVLLRSKTAITGRSGSVLITESTFSSHLTTLGLPTYPPTHLPTLAFSNYVGSF